MEMQGSEVTDRGRNWAAFLIGLIFTIWGLSHVISGKGGAGKWFVAWVVSGIAVVSTGGIWLIIHLPMSIVAAWIGSK